MSASGITITGLEELRATCRRLSTQVPKDAGDALEARTELEVRSREKVSGWRRPLDVTRPEETEVRVSWPYPFEGGVGTYIEGIMSNVARLLPDGLARDVGDVVIKAAK